MLWGDTNLKNSARPSLLHSERNRLYARHQAAEQTDPATHWWTLWSQRVPQEWVETKTELKEGEYWPCIHQVVRSTGPNEWHCCRVTPGCVNRLIGSPYQLKSSCQFWVYRMTDFCSVWNRKQNQWPKQKSVNAGFKRTWLVESSFGYLFIIES